MKRIVSILVLLTITSFVYAQESIEMINATEWSKETHVVFSSVVNYTTITIEYEYGIVSEMELPKGVTYSVEVLRKDHPWIDDDPFRQTIVGDVVIRVLREEELEIGQDLWEAMQGSPFQLALEDVKVTINDHREPGKLSPNK